MNAHASVEIVAAQRSLTGSPASCDSMAMTLAASRTPVAKAPCMVAGYLQQRCVKTEEEGCYQMDTQLRCNTAHMVTWGHPVSANAKLSKALEFARRKTACNMMPVAPGTERTVQ
jgi:hypothetical protein